MKKLALKLEALEVETFAVDEPKGKRGTVAAHDLTQLCMTPHCSESLDPRDVYCALQSPDGGNGYCTPVCYTYTCTGNPPEC